MQPKPPLALRRPSSPRVADEAAVETFVALGPRRRDAQVSEHPDGKAPFRPGTPAPGVPSPPGLSGPGLVQRRSGRVRRRMTVYLPPELAHKLLLYRATHGEEASLVITRALSRFFEGQ